MLVMSLQRYCDGCGDVPVDVNSVNVAVFPEVRWARFPQCLSDQGRLLLVRSNNKQLWLRRDFHTRLPAWLCLGSESRAVEDRPNYS